MPLLEESIEDHYGSLRKMGKSTPHGHQKAMKALKLRIKFGIPNMVAYSSRLEPDIINISWILPNERGEMEIHGIEFEASCEDFIPMVLEYEFIVWLITQMFDWDTSNRFDRLLLRNGEAHQLFFQETYEKFRVN